MLTLCPSSSAFVSKDLATFIFLKVLKSFSVAYTLSYFHYLTDNRIDLWKIYEEQTISTEVEAV